MRSQVTFPRRGWIGIRGSVSGPAGSGRPAVEQAQRRPAGVCVLLQVAQHLETAGERSGAGLPTPADELDPGAVLPPGPGRQVAVAEKAGRAGQGERPGADERPGVPLAVRLEPGELRE